MIVVTGATGNVGRALVQTLATERVTAVARRPPAGEMYRAADLADPATLRPVLDGADALFLIVAGDDPHGILDAAKAGGVRRVVLLSSQGAGTRPEIYRHPRAFEEAVTGSGLPWTVLRPGGFHTNAYAWAPTVRARRAVSAPFGDIALPTVDPADIASVAAAVLRGSGHDGHRYELTGPAATTPRQRAAAIADAIGSPVEFVEQTREEARAEMLGFMPPPVVEGTLGILGAPTDAETRVSPDVQRILGRAPRTFADWARHNADAFR
jgi:uncharacterized protein YbjT (DUF2867 family)